MPFAFDWPGFEALDGGLHALVEFDAMPLMQRWEDIVVEQNRTGILAGKDGFDNPMTPLRYRNGFGIRTGRRQVPNFGTTLLESTGHGPHATGLHDTLNSSQYLELTGPRLAPRREASRVIKNLMTEIRHDHAAGVWEVVGAWDGVVSHDGVPFLPFHFEGGTRLPKYDLRPVRPWAMQMALNALRAHVKELFLKRF